MPYGQNEAIESERPELAEGGVHVDILGREMVQTPVYLSTQEQTR